MSRAFRRIKKGILTRAFSVMPKGMRDDVVRSSVKLNYQPSPNLIFKLAETREELEQTFRLLYRAYVAAGSMKPDRSELRITPYHALPSTSVLIAKLNGNVVATLSVFRMGPFGVPGSKAFDVSAMLRSGERFAEISSLTVDDAYRTDSRELMFGLLKYLYEYTTRFFGIDKKLIVIKPFRRHFYESLLLFEPLDGGIVKNYSFSNGATVMAETLDLRTAPALYKQAYADKPDHQNLYKYFVETDISNFRFPDRNYHTVSDPVMTPELLSHFFCERTDLLSKMSNFERAVLQSLYPKSEYRLVLGRPNIENGFDRLEARLEVQCPSVFTPVGRRVAPVGQSFNVQVRDVSLNGLMGFTDDLVEDGDRFHGLIEVGPQRFASVEGRVRWRSGLGHFGLQLSKTDEGWKEFVSSSQFFGRFARSG